MIAYPVVRDAPGLIEFLKHTFGAIEEFRTVGSAGGIHCEMRIGDSRMMIGGGEPRPMAFHIYVPDVDATFQRALDAGAVALQALTDQEWGERTAQVKDPYGNNWYIATFQGENYFSQGAPTVQPYLHPVDAKPEIEFLELAFDARETGRATSPEGAILHTTLKIGDGALEITEAEGIYQPMPGMFYFYVPNVDESYKRALAAGATSISAPVDQSYGDRTAAVTDLIGNRWYLATPTGI